MRIYPDIPARRRAAILSDLLVLLLLVLLAWLGVRVHDAVADLASVPRGVGDAGGSIQRGFESAGGAVGDVPVVGGPLAGALQDAGDSAGGEIAAAGRQGEEDVNHLANVLGVLFFLLPAAGGSRATCRTGSRTCGGCPRPRGRSVPTLTPERERTLAMRAAYGLPYERLARYTRDPLADLESGRYDGLVAAALDDAGLRSRGRGT